MHERVDRSPSACAATSLVAVTQDPDDLRLAMAGGALRSGAAEGAVGLEALADALEEHLPPGTVTVTRRSERRWGRGRRLVAALAIDAGDWRYELERAPAGTSCRRRRIVRGIAVASDELDLPGWLDGLVAELERHAEVSAAGAARLRDLLT